MSLLCFGSFFSASARGLKLVCSADSGSFMPWFSPLFEVGPVPLLLLPWVLFAPPFHFKSSNPKIGDYPFLLYDLDYNTCQMDHKELQETKRALRHRDETIDGHDSLIHSIKEKMAN